MNPIVMTLMLLVAFGLFGWQVYPRIAVLLKLQKQSRWKEIAERLQLVALYGFIQKRMFRRPLAGLAHLFIFAAFMATQANTLAYFVRGYIADFVLPLPGFMADGYNFLKDSFWILCLTGIAYWATQRLIIKPWRLATSAHQAKALLILSFIASLAISEFFMQGAELVLAGRTGFLPSLPASSAFAMMMSGWSPDALHIVFTVGFWLHITVVLTFLNFLPLGKHFHVILAIPNIYTARLEERGHVTPPNLETTEKFGTATIADITWKQGLDTYACTECGRCLEYCPTALTNKPLTHRGLNLAIKDELQLYTPTLLGKNDEKHPKLELRELVGETNAPIHPDTIWACTTCGSCEVECPVFIDQVPRIIQMRQNLVLMRGEFPTELNRTFKGMEQHSNPWGIGSDKRDEWSEGLDIPRAADIAGEGGEIPLLYWIGCAGSFDDRVKKITLSMVKVLKAAKVPFCILGKEEGCTGDPARRLGNEYLFQTLATTNIEMLKNYKVKRILTACPHCLQTLKHDYKHLGGGDWEVIHHTELLAELVAQKKITPTKAVDAHVAFHDSCYLTRYNGIEEQPRSVMRSIPGLKVLEFDNNKSKGVCCGAGGGRFWMEEHLGTRINHHRVADGLAQNPDVIGSACPFCLTMLSDGVKDKGMDEKVKNRDIAELVADSLE